MLEFMVRSATLESDWSVVRFPWAVYIFILHLRLLTYAHSSVKPIQIKSSMMFTQYISNIRKYGGGIYDDNYVSLKTVSLRFHSHLICVFKPVFGIPVFPLTAKAM